MYGPLFASLVVSFQFTALGLVSTTEESASDVDRAPINIVLLHFEVLERGSTEMAKSVPEELRRLLRNDPKFAILSADKQALGPNAEDQSTTLMSSVDFVIAGSVYAGAGGRNFVALRIEDGRTGETVWSENYDYTNISAEMMATAAFDGLVSVIEARSQ